MYSVFRLIPLFLTLLLSLNGMAQVQAAVGIAWTGVQGSEHHSHSVHADDHSAALMNMSCCDEDAEHTQAAPCTSSHLCCTVVGLLQSSPAVSPVGVEPAPPVVSSLQPLPLALHTLWRPPCA